MTTSGAGLFRTELPVACTLGAGDGAARLRRWKALAEKSMPQAQRRDNQLEVRWQLAADEAIELDALTAAERECCSFLSWTVTRAGANSILTITADPSRPDDVAAIAALFAAT